MQQEAQELQFCHAQFKNLLNHSKQCQVKIVGMIKSVFSQKKYIIEVFLKNQLVIRSIRKFNEFEATYEVIKMKFQNFDLGVLPSKYQVFGKDQTRKQYFQWLINKIIENYNKDPENQASKRLFSIIYLFLTRSIHSGQNLQKSNISIDNNSLKRKQRKESANTHYSNNFQNQPSLLKKSADYSELQSSNITEFEVQRVKTRRRNSQSSMFQFSPDKQRPFKRDLREIKQNLKEKFKQNVTEKIKQNIKEKLKQKIINNFDSIEKADSEFQIRFQDEKQWKKRYLKIENSSLLIFKDKMENNFRSKMELFRIKVEYLHRQKNFFDHFCQKMEFGNDPTFSEDRNVITISHEYDYQKILIRGLSAPPYTNHIMHTEKIQSFFKNQAIKLELFKQALRKASEISPVKQKDEGVFNPIGKIFLVLHRVVVDNIQQGQKDILKVKIKSANLQFECKRLLLKHENVIRQGFFIPVSNTFETIDVDVIVCREQGWIRQQFKNLSLGYFPIQFSQILTKPEGHKFQKVNVVLKTATENNSDVYSSKATLEYSLENYSHFSSVYSESFANQNDGKIISGLKLEDMDELSVTVDRTLRVIGNIALFVTAFWRNVYLFKYPNLSRTFFCILLVLLWFAEVKIFIGCGFGVIIGLVVYNHPKLTKLLRTLADYLFFSYIHPNFVQPLCLGTSEIKYRKWCQALEQISRDFVFTKDNRLERKENKDKPNHIEYRFKVHQKVFIVTEQVKGILGKMFEGKKIIEIISRMISGAVNTIQKVGNMFLWVDGKRTCLVLIILIIFSGMASGLLIRFIGTVFCIHRLYKGMNFYKLKLYSRNRKIAVYTLRYILNRNFQNLIPNRFVTNEFKKGYINIINLEELDEVISDIDFPLNDENAVKKLKAELDKLISIYLDTDQLKQINLEQKLKQSSSSGDSKKGTEKTMMTNITAIQHITTKQKNLQQIKLSQIIKIIQTCEARLSLDWVAGKQGLSNQFQQLKELIKQTPLIDVWIERLLINFVLNIPSQMFVRLKDTKAKQIQDN